MSKKIKVIAPKVEDHIPSPDSEYIDVHGILDTSLSLVAPQEWIDEEEGAPPSSNLLFNSPHGMGKSLLSATLAVKLSELLSKPVPAIVFECSEDVRDYHLKGNFVLNDDGSTSFVLGPFPAAIHLANEAGCCVLVAEEISALTPGAQKQFNCMTDWRKGLYIPQIGTYYGLEGNARVIVVANMNPEGYGGVYSLNADLRSRFDECIIPYPSMEEEEQILKAICTYTDPGVIEKACQLARDTRPGCKGKQTFDYQLSTRDLVKLVENIHKLKNETEIPLQFVLNKFEGEDWATVENQIVAIFNVFKNGKKPAPMSSWNRR
jgi:hypothetical protein